MIIRRSSPGIENCVVCERDETTTGIKTSRVRVFSNQETKNMSRVFRSSPFTQIEPVTENFHGVEVTDPYRWLEDQDSERTRRWINEQTDYARSYLDAIPGRGQV